MRYLRQYRTTIVTIVLVGILIVYPFMVVALNPVPQWGALTGYVGQISLSGSMRDQVLVQLADGRVLNASFPSANYSMLKGYGESIVSTASRQHLKDGCFGVVRTDRTRDLFPISSVRRIWDLECNGGGISYQTLSSAYHRVQLGAYWIDGVVNLIALLFILFIAMADHKKLWHSKRGTR